MKEQFVAETWPMKNTNNETKTEFELVEGQLLSHAHNNENKGNIGVLVSEL